LRFVRTIDLAISMTAQNLSQRRSSRRSLASVDPTLQKLVGSICRLVSSSSTLIDDSCRQ
jgi:hypothetical protein